MSHLVYSEDDLSLLGFVTLAAGKFKGRSKDSDRTQNDHIPILEIDQFAIDENVDNKEEIILRLDKHVKGMAATMASRMIGCKFLFIWVENHENILDIFINKLNFVLVEDIMVTNNKYLRRTVTKHDIPKTLVSLISPILKSQ